MERIDGLYSGGLITNYHCSSRCRHCLYACSPKLRPDYVSPEKCEVIFSRIRSLGCNSIHIGGGEPMLNFPALCEVLKCAERLGISIEYIESNSSWVNDLAQAEERLLALKALNVSTMLLSISPFHNEYIPLVKVKNAIKACRNAGMNVFPWIADFFDDLETVGSSSDCHGPDEYAQCFGKEYDRQLAGRYSLTLRGRALKSYVSSMTMKPVAQILADSPGGCRELFNVSHFHIDLYGNYIPGLCTGLSIQVEDLGQPLDDTEYPVLSVLADLGIDGLLKFASRSHGFEPAESYASKCHLCHSIRSYLKTEMQFVGRDLCPDHYYHELGQF